MRRFRCGLVVGKFSPLHRGHEALIRYAQAECDEVVIIGYSKPEYAGCGARRRAAWLEELFPSARSLVVTDEFLRARGSEATRFVTMPGNEAPDLEHREFCAFLCDEHFRCRIDAVFSSEDYGDGLADHLTRHYRSLDPAAGPVRHVCLDRSRARVPVSGSLIRSDIHAQRRWLSPCVYASFIRRVCILGGESSGKSVLASALADRFQTVFVAEFGRELWMLKSGRLDYEDMLDIARRQISREQRAAREGDRFLFCDTSPLTTLFYSLEMFGSADPQLQSLASRPYDAYVLCAPDFEFVQDGTRRDAAFRQRQHDWYVDALHQRSIAFVLAEGTVAARVERIAAWLRCEHAP